MNAHLLVLFVLAVTVVTAVPGPDMLFVLSSGMRGGPRAGLLATCGVATSEAIHITVAAAGLSALFAAAPTTFLALRIVGAGYLILLGAKSLRRRASTLIELPSPIGVSYRQTFLRGLLTNLLNPKMITFTVAFLPQFVDHRLGHLPLQFAVLGVIFLAVEFVIDGSVALAAGRVGRWLQARQRARRRLDIVTGGVFVALGLRLAVER